MISLTFTRKFINGLITLTLLLTACHKDTIVIQPAQQNSIPLTISYANNSVTPIITININGVNRQVIFDTGSAGLRLLVGAADPSTLEPHADTLRYLYGDGGSKLIVKGNIAGAYFSPEPSMGTSSIRFMLIDSMGRTSDGILHPVIATETADPDFRNLSGVLGVGLTYNGDGCANPLAQLPGNGKYIVEFPAYGKTSGTVIVNPTGSALEGFTLFDVPLGNVTIPNGDNSWNDHKLNGLVTLNGIKLTNPILFDTGTPQMILTTSLIPPGDAQNGSLSYGLIATGETQPAFISSLAVNQVPGSGQVQVNPVNSSNGASSNLGTVVFFDYDVLYDQVNGKIGLRKK